jgi:metallophosphoesterase (TIGR00282 family)
MKILFIGDISARPGREVVGKVLPDIKKRLGVDFVIANVENSAGGRGVTLKVLNELQSYGVDFFTSGEHIWDQKEINKAFLESNIPITRPYNYEATNQLPGQGYKFIDLGKNKLLVINLLGQTFMKQNVRSPFWSFDELWEEFLDNREESRVEDNTIVIVDFHAEATAEKISFAWYIKDRVSAVLGTHTHVATADTRILGDKAGFVTDVGMCGPRDASLWVKFDNAINNFRFPQKQKFEVELEGERIFNSVLVEFDGNKCVAIERVDEIIR